MPYDFTFHFDELPKTQADQHAHRMLRHRYRKHWHRYVAELVMIQRAKLESPLPHAFAEFVRHSSVEPDDDNLASSFKPVRDGFVRAGILTDDRRANLTASYRWEKALPKEGHITVRVRSEG